MVEDRKAFDQMKELSQTLEAPGADHDDQPPSDRSRCSIALTEFPIAERSEIGVLLPISRGMLRTDLRQFSWKAAGIY